eukprot:TRINITY_DN105786_c0_g1_i1.p1 TRINITY_DN105786_c0_g1~~TRINITY_DN105786_c0_g1_i1.p1  ORF type:complete len:562 (-),score=118.97 TRINITY_DN105786_c0_g1_i1:91-1662(-)
MVAGLPSPQRSSMSQKSLTRSRSSERVEDLLSSFTASFHAGDEDKKREPSSFCDQLEMLQQQKELGCTVKDFMETIKTMPKVREKSSMQDFMSTLDFQKAQKRRIEDSVVKKHEAKVRAMQRSASAPSLEEKEKAIKECRSKPHTKAAQSLEPQGVSSTWRGSANYSFGKPAHKKGPFKIQVLNPRDPEYFAIPGGVPVPGVGTYTLRSTTLPEVSESGGGQSGGWAYADHKVFMEQFKKHGRKASELFFEHMYHELPHVPPLAVVDHVRWLANFELNQAGKQWKLDEYREEQKLFTMTLNQKFPSAEEYEAKEKSKRKEVLAEKRKNKDLLAQADVEEKRLGISRKETKHDFQPHQRFEGEVIEGNLRGAHPCYKKSPGYSFAYSREDRDLQGKKKTDLSHVRSSSHWDNPGPGQYIGLEEQSRPLKQAPSWTMRKKLPPQKVDAPADGGPGYDGPLHAWDRLEKDLEVIQTRKPRWTMGKEDARAYWANSNEQYAVLDKFSTPPEVGPGKYEHATCMVSQF